MSFAGRVLSLAFVYRIPENTGGECYRKSPAELPHKGKNMLHLQWRCLVVSCVLLGFCLLCARAADPARVKLIVPPNLPVVYKQAQKEKKNVLLYVMSPNCRYCQKLELEVYGNPVIAALLNRFFLTVKADTSTKAGKELAGGHAGSGVPNQVVFDATGKKLFSEAGARTPSSYLYWLMKNYTPDKAALLEVAEELAAPAKLAKLRADDLHALAQMFLTCEKKERIPAIYGAAVLPRLKTPEEKNDFSTFWAFEMREVPEGALPMQVAVVKQLRTGQSYNTLASMYHQSGDAQKALEAVQEAIRLDPKEDIYQKNAAIYRKSAAEAKAAAAPELAFQPVESIAKATEAAANAKKLVFLYVDAPSCGWCKHMKQRVLRDPRVQMVLEKSYLPVKADVSTGAGKELVKGYPGNGTPREYLIGAKGETLDAAYGAFRETEEFLMWLLKAANPERAFLDQLAKELPPMEDLQASGFKERQYAAYLLHHTGKKDLARKLCGPESLAGLKSIEERNSYAWFWVYYVGDNFKSALEVQLQVVKEKKSPDFLDTLAYCHYVNGEVAEALKIQEELCKSNKGSEYARHLEQFRAAATKTKPAEPGNT